ncbi:LPXTG cell wall anchor domain-containing protein, partial [Parageobacillus thermoglucosidasius]|nr:LPXTG cell wall anchor domain-containing protein [Parageobacillus thermoglucosidasius]
PGNPEQPEKPNVQTPDTPDNNSEETLPKTGSVMDSSMLFLTSLMMILVGFVLRRFNSKLA